MNFSSVLIIAKKEARESLANRWFVVYTLCFSLLALLLLFIASGRSEIAGYTGYGRTAASLINLVLLFVPMVALLTGAMSIAAERESGTLGYLLSYPVNKGEVFVGKYLGVLTSIWSSILLGFGIAGVGVALVGGGGGALRYLAIAGFSLLLAAALLSVGFLISVYVRGASKALGIGVFLWLVFIVFGDLGIMGSTVAMDLGIKQVFAMALFNPTEVFKMISVLVVSPRFEVLGPVGVYAMRTFGKEGVFAILFGAFLLWTLIPLGAAYYVFCSLRREET